MAVNRTFYPPRSIQIFQNVIRIKLWRGKKRSWTIELISLQFLNYGFHAFYLMTFANSENVLSFLMLPHTDKNSATAPLFGNQFFATSSSAFLVIHTSKKRFCTIVCFLPLLLLFLLPPYNGRAVSFFFEEILPIFVQRSLLT